MKKSRIISLAVLVTIFAAVAWLGLAGVMTGAEAQVHKFLNPAGGTNFIFKAFTDLGEAVGVIGVILVFLVLPATRCNIGVPLGITVASSFLVSRLIKELAARERPLEKLLEVGGYSFPSGHATNNAALYIGIMLLVLPLLKKRRQKIAVSAVCILTTLIIGISRVYFNVHYLSDVICGWCLGAMFAIVFTEMYFKLEKRRAEKHERN